MLDLILVLALISASPGDAAGSVPSAEATDTFQLEVFAFDPQGEALPGVQLSLCPLDEDDTTDLDDDSDLCFLAFSRQEGRGVFPEVGRGRYRLRGRLSGMASTTISPVQIPLNMRDPDRVVMVFNPTNACRGGG